MESLHDGPESRQRHVEVVVRVTMEGLHECCVDQNYSSGLQYPIDLLGGEERIREMFKDCLTDDCREYVAAKRENSVGTDNVDVRKVNCVEVYDVRTEPVWSLNAGTKIQH